MDRGWISLLGLLYVLLGLPVLTMADRGARLDAVLGFSTVYVLVWILIVLWYYGERFLALVESSPNLVKPRPPDKHVPPGASHESLLDASGLDELPDPVRAALGEAAQELESFRASSPGSLASSGQVVESLAKRVINAIQTPDSTDSCVKHLPGGRVRIIIGVLIPSDGPRRTVVENRKQLRQQLEAKLTAIGWRQVKGGARYTYQHDSASR